MTFQIAREGPCWKNLLMSVTYSIVDVNVKRNDMLLTMARDFLDVRECQEGEAVPAAVVSCAQ